MAVQVSYPGVYIEEFAPGAPIQGVGTSTAAFIGVAASGDLDEPTKLTSWDQFKQIFGEQPVPGFFSVVRGAWFLRERWAGLLYRARKQRRLRRTSP
jgi:hypothetical protein